MQTPGRTLNAAGPGPESGPAGTPNALYLHIPFCRSRCHYCDFNTYAGMDGWMGDYLEALAAEARRAAGEAPAPPVLTSLYLGGGTPSRIAPGALAGLTEALRQAYDFAPGAELSLEANPGELSLEFLRCARSLGYSRVSLGMQAGDDATLAALGRAHRHSETVEAVARCRQAGFANVSLDLMAGVPGQSLEGWQRTVERALELEPAHLSVYALSVEPGTALETQIARRRRPAPDDDLAADMLDWLDERLPGAGLRQYEISNWAAGETGPDGQPAFACRHNLVYWRNEGYLGLGAGAHGYAAGLRYANVRPIPEYVRRIRADRAGGRFPLSPAVESWRQVEADEAARDSMLLGLRLTESGVRRAAYVARHGLPQWQAMLGLAAPLEGQGLLEWQEQGEAIRLTGRGRRLGNRVFREFV